MSAARVETLFTALLECTPAHREGRLAELGVDEPTLAAELRSLLAAADSAKGFLSHSPLPPGWAQAESEDEPPCPIGQRIGPYRLERKLGQGGMGTVYLAARADGQYHQQVALKLIRPGAQATLRVQRFRAERQILAQLTHPYIARLLDGGSQNEGQPYLVMEYVQGEPIDTYCRQRGPGLTKRLRLFAKVCEAVEYAHRHGVIHRDLKPGNILVTAGGEPKLLDFGVAKLLTPGLQGALTVDGRSPMTPDFAAPEQLNGGAITPATDVYALGLILYELLTGRQPGACARKSKEDTPPLPSRVVARNRRWRLKGDLDNIVQRALAYSAPCRYGSAGALAEDIMRYLRHHPVGASGHAPHYRLKKFFERYRVTAGLTGLVALAMFAGGLSLGPGEREEIGAGRLTLARATSFDSAPATESPHAERCAALQKQYQENKSRALFAQSGLCQLDDAEWHNSRGDYQAALQTLEVLFELRWQDRRGYMPPALLAERGRFLTAVTQAHAGSGNVREAKRYQRRLAAWTRRRERRAPD